MLLVALLVLTAEPPPMAPPPPNPDRVDSACRDATGQVIDCPSEKPLERLEPEKKPDDGDCTDKKERGPDVLAITGLVGSAGTVAGALTAVVVGVVQIPAPWDYWRFAGELQKAQIQFRKKPDAIFLRDADRARSGMHKIESAANDEVGLFVTSGVTLVTSGVGLVTSIITVAGE